MYYSLPFCKPEKDTETHMEGLGEALQGYELRKSPILIEFRSKKKIQKFLKL